MQYNQKKAKYFREDRIYKKDTATKNKNKLLGKKQALMGKLE
jgi:hypothetical protein